MFFFPLFTALAMLGFGVSALRLNPKRPINQALATVCFLSVLIFAAQLVAKRLGVLYLADRSSNPLPWIRLKFGLIGLLSPLMVWVCYYLVSGRYSSRRDLLRKLAPWIALSAFLFFFPFTEAFKPNDSLPGNVRYGSLYYLYFLPMLAGQLAVCISALVVAPKLIGVRKLELHFITIALGYLSLAAVLAETLYATWPQFPGAKSLTFFLSYIVYLVFGIIALSVTSRRIYHTGQVALSILERSLLLTVVCFLAALGLRFISRNEPGLFSEAIVLAASFLLLSFCDDKLRGWLKLKAEQQTNAVVSQLYDAANASLDPDKLIESFEHTLKSFAVGAPVEILVLDRNQYVGKSLKVPAEILHDTDLFTDGSISTASFARAPERTGQTQIHSLLVAARLAVLVCPRWTKREPSVVIAFGERESKLPFTHPEIRLLSELAEVVDSLYTRARLALQAQQSEQLASIGRLGATIAHELRNPMWTLKSFAQLLPEKMADRSFLREFSEIVPKETDRIEALAEQLLDLSKPRRYSFRRTDLHKIIGETVTILRARADDDQIRIVMRLDAVRPEALMDADAIRQVLINLLRNASEAVMQREAERTIEIRTQDLTDRLAFEVEDNGPGLPKEIRGKLFDTFASHGKQSGVGLGLAICREIVKVHGGSISADLAREHGCVFRVTIPR